MSNECIIKVDIVLIYITIVKISLGGPHIPQQYFLHSFCSAKWIAKCEPANLFHAISIQERRKLMASPIICSYWKNNWIPLENELKCSHVYLSSWSQLLQSPVNLVHILRVWGNNFLLNITRAWIKILYT